MVILKLPLVQNNSKAAWNKCYHYLPTAPAFVAVANNCVSVISRFNHSEKALNTHFKIIQLQLMSYLHLIMKM